MRALFACGDGCVGGNEGAAVGDLQIARDLEGVTRNLAVERNDGDEAGFGHWAGR